MNTGGIVSLFSYPMFNGDGIFQALPLGKASAQLVRTYTATYNNDIDDDFLLEYDVNAEGYVTGINYGTGLGLVTYEYECK